MPILLLLLMVAVDFGRIYLGYINVQNMARIAANFAADHPRAWLDNDTTIKADYQNEIANDAKANNCALPGGVAPDPTFPAGTKVGGSANVSLTCTFSVITPVISAVLGSGVAVSTTSVFPIKFGNLPISCTTSPPNSAFSADPTSGNAPLTVQFTDTSTCSPTTWHWDFGDLTTASTQVVAPHTYPQGSYNVCLTVSNAVGTDATPACRTIVVSPTPPPQCTVPDFTDTSTSDAQTTWEAMGFKTTVEFKQGGLPWTIKSQNVTGGSSVACDSPIRVSKTSTP